ncbi:RNA 2',3'-cyclic phosphodiesterase [Pseudomaricurvus sp. HS19]|uniref:RNA 2',3'-cyclic phosphodiesterase n=1 Tax=Pseudomaricurvus sp. HS19 TaxID=2692626 RepID=UPI00136D505B|nr:RNA 2',3'-cyclic phosphodiesterase [Pseudomaricurvus sp. HS19]MYM62314.1 RNA 2',3'-cyclic phosphodiesterase [Pseudomaricurvus sp. HS19]
MDPLEKISTPSSDPFRGFIAVEVEAEYGLLLESALRSTLSDCLRPQWREIPRHNYHLTLVFLGNLPPGLLHNLATAMLSCRDHHEFSLQPQRIDFLNRRRGDLIVALFGREQLNRLEDLQRQLVASLDPATYQPTGKPFRPHITLARRKRSARQKIADELSRQLPAGLRLPPLPVRSVALFESQLTPDGSIYHPLLRVPLTHA